MGFSCGFSEKKKGSTRFCVDYRCACWVTSNGFLLWTWLADTGRWPCRQMPNERLCLSLMRGFINSRVMPFGLCNAPATFERLMDRVLCGMRRSRCLVYLDDVISFGTTAPETLQRLEEVLKRLSAFRLQLRAKKCTFMQTEVAFLGHIVGRSSLACDPGKVSAVWAWHAPGWLNKFASFIGYYRRFIHNFAGL